MPHNPPLGTGADLYGDLTVSTQQMYVYICILG